MFGAIMTRMTRSRAMRIAAVLWIVWAIVAWNVVFDQTLVVAGRRYIVAAVAAAQGEGPYENLDSWMRPALARGLWLATATAVAILATGFVSLRFASRRRRIP